VEETSSSSARANAGCETDFVLKGLDLVVSGLLRMLATLLADQTKQK
jgi:hypothetical protein